MKLVIAEKPSVARSIAAVIGATDRQEGYFQGNGYIVTWCVGHLAGLADAGVYDERFKKWRYEDLPIIPESWRFTISENKRERFDTLRTLMRSDDVAEVVNACDAGREGELIFRTVYYLAGCTKPMKRLWISSMEDSAIREALSLPGESKKATGFPSPSTIAWTFVFRPPFVRPTALFFATIRTFVNFNTS